MYRVGKNGERTHRGRKVTRVCHCWVEPERGEDFLQQSFGGFRHSRRRRRGEGEWETAHLLPQREILRVPEIETVVW
jgi:hypothetical protein